MEEQEQSTLRVYEEQIRGIIKKYLNDPQIGIPKLETLFNRQNAPVGWLISLKSGSSKGSSEIANVLFLPVEGVNSEMLGQSSFLDNWQIGGKPRPVVIEESLEKSLRKNFREPNLDDLEAALRKLGK